MNAFFRSALSIALVVPVIAERAHADDSVTALPRKIADIAVADSGRLVVVQLSGESSLRIYDPLKRDFVGRIDTQVTECVFGAGGNSLVFFRPSDSVLESWDLQTRKRIESVTFLDPGPIVNIVMGSANGDEALISAVAAGGPGGLHGPSTQSLKLLNARTLQPIWELTTGPGLMGFMGGMGDRGMQYRSDRFLTKICGWATSGSPSGAALLVRRDRDFEQLYEHSSEGYLAMSDDGNIYTESGRVLTDDPNRNEQRGAQQMPMPPFSGLVSRGSISDGKPFPGMGGVFLLVLGDNNKLLLLEASTRSVITELGELPAGFYPEKPKEEKKEDAFRRPPDAPGFPGAAGMPNRQPAAVLALEKRVIFAPELGYILFAPYTNDKLVVRPFNVKEAVQTRKAPVYHFRARDEGSVGGSMAIPGDSHCTFDALEDLVGESTAGYEHYGCRHD